MDWPLDQSFHLEATILPTKIASKMSTFYPASTHSRPFMLAQSYLPFWDSKLSTFLINVLLGKNNDLHTFKTEFVEFIEQNNLKIRS